jgi:hypothetical protein
MITLRWSGVAGVGALTLLLAWPSIADSCPRRGFFVRGGASYQPYTPVSVVSASAPAAVEAQASNDNPIRPAAFDRTVPAAETATLPPPRPRVVPLSVQTPNDNFDRSGQ